jgi:DNA-binding response OmpR family regulator
MPRVLVVDDEVEITELLRDYLLAEGFQVEVASDSDSCLRAMEETEFDCIALDVMMPGMSGFELCRLIRQKWIVPILFLSAREADVDKIRGLGLGADDFVGKSASLPEVVSRIKALVRRYRTFAVPASDRCGVRVMNFGHFEINPEARTVKVKGELCHFTAKEFDLLLFLAQHRNQVFTREQLFYQIWGDFGDLHTVTVHIGKLREKIEPDPSNPIFIKTVWGVGYRFEGGLRE